jgi:RNA polymerase sigma-70 factor (ECF subfamily)
LPETGQFHELIQRARSGNLDAATELVRTYEPAIRRTVRIMLLNARLRRVFDSMDICQSVMGSFFVRLSLGQFQVEEPAQLIKLLVSMTRNKVADQARKEQAECRDHRRIEAGDVHDHDVAGAAAGPSQIVAARDLLEQVRSRLSPEELRLADRRAVGRDWPDIAAELGGSPDALRKKFTRAINRVTRELGLDEPVDD